MTAAHRISKGSMGLLALVTLLSTHGIVEAQAVTNYYTISGTSNGVGWSVSVTHPGGTIFEPSCAPVGAGGTAADLAAAFITCLNALAWTGSAMANPNDANGLCVTCPAGDFDLGVGPTGGTGSNKVDAAGQSFNPMIFLVKDGNGSAIPTVSEWGLIILTLLGMTAGTIILARRRRPATAPG